MINTMNDQDPPKPEEHDPLLEYQTQRLQGLIADMVQCCHDRLEVQSKKFDLPQAELKCLLLFGDERYLTVKGIVLKLDVAKSRVVKILEGLERRGMTTRTNDPQDARIRLIGLTPEGRRKSEAVTSFMRDIHQSILLQLEPEERRSILSSLETLRAAMEAVKQSIK